MAQQNQNQNKHSLVYLLVFIVLMVVVFYFFPDKLVPSLESFWQSLSAFIIIFPAIILLIGIFSVMITPEMIAKNFGTESGFWGTIKALIFGSFMSTGPLYLAFPLGKNLLDKGAKVSDVVIFISAWNGIGVIAEIVELHFMGFVFMVIRCTLLTIFILLMGFVEELLVNRRSK